MDFLRYTAVFILFMLLFLFCYTVYKYQSSVDFPIFTKLTYRIISL